MSLHYSKKAALIIVLVLTGPALAQNSDPERDPLFRFVRVSERLERAAGEQFQLYKDTERVVMQLVKERAALGEEQRRISRAQSDTLQEISDLLKEAKGIRGQLAPELRRRVLRMEQFAEKHNLISSIYGLQGKLTAVSGDETWRAARTRQKKLAEQLRELALILNPPGESTSKLVSLQTKAGATKEPVASAQTRVDSPPRSRGRQKLLGPADFSFVGSYPFSAAGQANFGMGLTHRRVDGKLRFLTFSYEGRVKARLIEFALPQKLGQRITTLTNHWDDIWSPAPHPSIGSGDEHGLWWEDLGNGKGRLWTTHSTDYPVDGTGPRGASNPLAVAVRELNSDGSVSNVHGDHGFERVGQRAIYGGVQRLPQWFRDEYRLAQPYAVGWGGYSSRMAQGLVCSMGLMVLAIPDVTSYRPNSIIPTRDFRILADHRSGTTTRDWYSAATPSSFDRGRRNADVLNYFDGGDKRSNPSSPPSGRPAQGAHWLSPAPDGFGRLVWGDTYFGTGCWIDGSNKGGFIVIGTFASGKTYYGGSTLHYEGRHAELQIFDPHDFGKVHLGRMPPWNVQPSASKLLSSDLTPLGLLYGRQGSHALGGVVGATFDATTGFLYLWCTGVNRGYGCCLVVYKVNC